MIRTGTILSSRYEILEQIGSGGMAYVYKARDRKLSRLVAIKILKEEFCKDKSFVAKFRMEAQAAAGLSHNNVVGVYDVGEENNVHYIVMELIDGITLKEYITRKRKLGTKESIGIAIQVAQGLEAAHKRHIVHRDIKPQNVIISKEGKVKVTDFGIAVLRLLILELQERSQMRQQTFTVQQALCIIFHRSRQEAATVMREVIFIHLELRYMRW